jgi:hypothetical protein
MRRTARRSSLAFYQQTFTLCDALSATHLPTSESKLFHAQDQYRMSVLDLQ